MGVFERNGHWYFEVMIRKKRYCKAIPEATNRKDAEKWKNAVSQMGMEWTQLSDLKGWGNEISSSLGIRSIPFTVLVDSKARVIAAGLRVNSLEEAIKNELDQKSR